MSNDVLFYSVWRNKYLNNLIITQLELFNLNYHTRLFQVDELNVYQFKDYLNSVIIINIKEHHVPILSTLLPSTIKHLEFGDEDFNYKILPSTFSACKQLESIKFNDLFNQELVPGSIPNTVKRLEFGFHYNKSFTVDSLPSHLEYLDMGYKNENELINGVLPSSLKELKLSSRYNYKFEVGCLPPSLKTLDTGYKYNKKFIPNALPSGLECLKLSGSFNKCLDNIPRDTLKSLYIGKFYQHSLFNYNIIQNIVRLEFGQDWNIPKVPSKENILSIEYNGNFKEVIKMNDLPPSIKSLVLNSQHCKSLGKDLIQMGAIPNGLIELTVSDLISPELIPSSVKTYNIECTYNKPIDPSLFPPSITHLKINSGFNQTLTPGSFNNMKYLQSLQLQLSFNNGETPLSNGIFPDSLKYLEVGDFYNQSLANSLSYTLIQHLVLGKAFNSTLRSTQLPKSLKSLFIKNNTMFDYQFEVDSLPQSLELLYIESGVQQELSIEWLPSNLKYIIIIGNPIIKSLPKSITSIITHGNNNQFINSFKSQFKLQQYLTLLKVYSLNYLTNNNNIIKIINKFI